MASTSRTKVGYWVEHGRRFRRGDELVAAPRQEVRGVEDGELVEVERLAALYVAQDGRLIRHAEFADIATAFAASSVTESDELSSA